MTRGQWAPLCFLAVAMCAAEASRAGVWGTQPVVGLSGDYSSNPALLNLPHSAQTDAAALLDAPTTYQGDEFKLSILPQLRVSDRRGYSSIDSDYAHLLVSGEFDTERSALSLSVGADRDSSLYRDYLTNGTAGVRRDTGTADVDWSRRWTERLKFAVDTSAVRVRFGSAAGTPTLTDYQYYAVKPTITWKQSEAGEIDLAAGAGRYDSLDRTTESRSEYAQLGYTRKLNELWTLSAAAGYVHALNREDLAVPTLVITPSGPVIQGVARRLRFSQTGAVYSASLIRRMERYSVSVQATRQLMPSGFAFLTREDTYEIDWSYQKTDRLTFNGALRRIKYQNPAAQGFVYDVTVSNVNLSASYRWTPHWTAALAVTRVLEHVGSPAIAVAASNVSLTLSRQFGWSQLP